ncbi:MAG TPA: LamG-like jellyroll fold domain-containing protein [Sedimentisphaerales bacterium]|nr:LamG-like jellyroll fold domain-containing protein [Sedimentisphaerales bacterium]
MCKKLICLVSPILLLALASNAVAQLDPASITDGNVYLFENVVGDVPDDSANSNTANLIGSPQVVDGLKGKALQFNGTSDGVHIPDAATVNLSTHQNRTVIAIFQCADVTKPEKQVVYEEGGTTRGLTIYVHESLVYAGGWNLSDYTPEWTGTFLSAPISSGAWYAVAMVVRDGIAAQEDDKFEMWMDGELIATGPGGQLQSRSNDCGIGYANAQTKFHDGNFTGGGSYFEGTVDEIWIVNAALTQVELGGFAGKVWPFSFGPTPADGALNMDTWVSLSWTPGGFAVSHDVYLGENFDDVNAGAESVFQGNQAGTDFIIGFPGFAFPDGLVPGTTYYWRVDEVNEAEPNSPWKGSIWSFSIPPKTAYFPDPADGAESVDPNADLSWTPGFGAKLHHAYFGDNFDDVYNAAGALPLGEATYDPGPLELAKTYYWRVDEFDIIETHKGDVWSFTTEGAVEALEPAKGAVDVTQTPVLTWVPGVFADTHEVYFGTDAEAVKNADTSSPEYKGSGNLGSESFEPGQLEWNTTYYWRIDEANNANADSPWTGPLWSFTTANFLIVDDFESYNDLDPADPESNRIFNAWLDGYDDPTNGSLVGYETPPFAEQTIVHSGNQSIPMSYDNAVGKSEATLTLTSNRDWTVNGVNRLTIWFRGSGGNAAETMYVVLNGSAGVDNDDPSAVQTTRWTEWNIDLQAFADQGVDLANVNSITLGLGNRTNPVAGGAGMMYFDDICLYATTP